MARSVDSDSQQLDVGKSFPKPCYPPTISFASSPSENRSKVVAGGKSRRPGGSMRGKGPWKTACNTPHAPTEPMSEDHEVAGNPKL